MSNSPVIILALRSADGRTLLPVKAGHVIGETPDGGWLMDIGTFEQLNWWWRSEEGMMSLALITHQTRGSREARPTPLTGGQRRLDGLEVAGDLSQLLAVVKRSKKGPAGETSTRDEATDPPVDATTPTTGMAALVGTLVVLTPEGLGRLQDVLTSGGKPRSEFDRAGQDGEVPAGVLVGARFASWRAEGIQNGWAFPIRFGLEEGTDAQTEGTTTRPATPADFGAGTFRRDEGPPTRIVQTLPSGAERVIREAGPGESGPAFAPGLVPALSATAARQMVILERIVPLMQQRAAAEAAGQPVDGRLLDQIRVGEFEVRDLNRSFAALGGDPGQLGVGVAGSGGPQHAVRVNGQGGFVVNSVSTATLSGRRGTFEGAPRQTVFDLGQAQRGDNALSITDPNGTPIPQLFGPAPEGPTGIHVLVPLIGADGRPALDAHGQPRYAPRQTVFDIPKAGPHGDDPRARAAHPKVRDITGDPFSGSDVVEVWGKLDPYDETTRTWLDEEERGRDPEGYRERAKWAPHLYLELDGIIAPPPPPPPHTPPPLPPEPPKKPPPWDPQERDIFVDPGGTRVRDDLPSYMIFMPPAETIEDGAASHEGIPIIDTAGQDDEDFGDDPRDAPVPTGIELPPTQPRPPKPPANCPISVPIPGGIGQPGTPTWGGARNRGDGGNVA